MDTVIILDKFLEFTYDMSRSTEYALRPLNERLDNHSIVDC